MQFFSSGDPQIEKIFRTHYVSPALSERKQQQLQGKLEKAPHPVVYLNLHDAQCSGCGAEIAQGSMLLMDADEPLCLHCARLDDLEFLPAGDTALTRRATRYSERAAVVVRFNRSRKRYERQGILVEETALEKAEQECVQDADERAAARARAAVQRGEQACKQRFALCYSQSHASRRDFLRPLDHPHLVFDGLPGTASNTSLNVHFIPRD